MINFFGALCQEFRMNFGIVASGCPQNNIPNESAILLDIGLPEILV